MGAARVVGRLQIQAALYALSARNFWGSLSSCHSARKRQVTHSAASSQEILDGENLCNNQRKDEWLFTGNYLRGLMVAS
jgi:hypothetical protein